MLPNSYASYTNLFKGGVTQTDSVLSLSHRCVSPLKKLIYQGSEQLPIPIPPEHTSCVWLVGAGVIYIRLQCLTIILA